MKQVSCGAGDSGTLMVEGPMLRVRIGLRRGLLSWQ